MKSRDTLSPAKRRLGLAIGVLMIPAVMLALYALLWLVNRYWFRL